jgi:hypothetical protein
LRETIAEESAREVISKAATLCDRPEKFAIFFASEVLNFRMSEGLVTIPIDDQHELLYNSSFFVFHLFMEIVVNLILPLRRLL